MNHYCSYILNGHPAVSVSRVDQLQIQSCCTSLTLRRRRRTTAGRTSTRSTFTTTTTAPSCAPSRWDSSRSTSPTPNRPFRASGLRRMLIYHSGTMKPSTMHLDLNIWLEEKFVENFPRVPKLLVLQLPMAWGNIQKIDDHPTSPPSLSICVQIHKILIFM